MLLIEIGECRDAVTQAITQIEEIATQPDHNDYPQAVSVLDRLNNTSQRPRDRVIYDLRRHNYKRTLSLILERKGIARIVSIIGGDDPGKALDAVKFLHESTKTKPVQKHEVKGTVTHAAVQLALAQGPIQANGEWINPETALEDSQESDALPSKLGK